MISISTTVINKEGSYIRILPWITTKGMLPIQAVIMHTKDQFILWGKQGLLEITKNKIAAIIFIWMEE
jgi:hypothetical protein